MWLQAADWGDDGYSVEGGENEPDGSSVYNTWRLAMGKELDAAAARAASA